MVIDFENLLSIIVLFVSVGVAMFVVKKYPLDKDHDFYSSEYDFWCGNSNNEKNQNNSKKSSKQKQQD